MLDNLTLTIILVLLGLALLVAELFIPSFGVLTALATVSFVVGIAFAFNVDLYVGFATIGIVFLVLPLFGYFVFNIWPHTFFGKRLFLQTPQNEDKPFLSHIFAEEMKQFEGRFGRTVSPLRPAGITEFDGRRVDTVSEGNMIGPGQWVQCIGVEGSRVIVRPVEGPPDLEDLDLA